jgi:segregation and condensation protein B
MSEEKQQHEETAIAAEESNDDLQNEQPVDDQTVEQVDEQAIAEILAEDEMIEAEFLSFDEEEDAESIRIIASDENLAETAVAPPEFPSELPDEADDDITATREELKPVIEALLFVADEPLPFKQLCKILGDVPEDDVRAALEELVAGFEARGSGLEVREIAGGWRISTRPQHHDFIRKYLKSRPTARLSLPALETLAVIAYKQPITIPEILEIRGVSSTSAIKTLLEKRLIVTKGRKETVGRPMMYGTSKEFLIQFGLKDLTELPSIEDFEDLAQ